MKKTIKQRKPITETGDFLVDLHPLLRRIYLSRGVQEEAGLEKDLTALLPFEQLMGMDVAVKCLYEALVSQKRFLIVGDFDADGATSTALAVTALKSFGAQSVNYRVPNRFKYGYGLTPEIVDAADELKPEFIITVDNGISSCEGVARAKSKGIQVLVTDHHLPGDTLPDADAIVNPNQKGDLFPSKNLAGVGVIFYVMLALRAYLREKDWFVQQGIDAPNMAQLLDLVALGTVADVVPLDHNNRILVHQGLQRIRNGRARAGIRTLLEVAKRRCERLVASDLGFAVAPRLNAAGRLDDMSVGIACLLEKEEYKAREYALQLDKLNQERRSIEANMQKQALKAVDDLRLDPSAEGLPKGFCLFEESWHQGVIGIVAGRVKERFHRPVIAFALADNDTIKGSARSIQGLHIRDLLDLIAKKHPDLIDKFGGHAMAAGLSLSRSRYPDFVKAFNDALDIQLAGKGLGAVIESDGTLEKAELTLEVAELLRESGPWGQTFPEPIFNGSFNIVDQRLVGGKHLKLLLSQEGGNKMIDAIAFNVDLNIWPNHRCDKISAAYRLDVNEYRGIRSLQLMLEYIEVGG